MHWELNEIFPLALPAGTKRFLHSGIQIYLLLPLHFARMQSVEMTIAVSGTFEKTAYGFLCECEGLGKRDAFSVGEGGPRSGG